MNRPPPRPAPPKPPAKPPKLPNAPNPPNNPPDSQKVALTGSSKHMDSFKANQILDEEWENPTNTQRDEMMEEQIQAAKESGRTSVAVKGYGRVQVPKEEFAFSDKEFVLYERKHYGYMSWYMGMDNITAGIICGIGAMNFGAVGYGKEHWGTLDIVAGIFAFFVGPAIGFCEYKYGQHRGVWNPDKGKEGEYENRSYPARAIIYFFCAIIPLFSFGTLTLAIYYICNSVLNFLAWKKGEIYPPPKPRRKEEEVTTGMAERFTMWYRTMIAQGDAKKNMFIVFWCLLNFIIMCERWNYYFNDALELGGLLPFWFGMAKAFGTLLDLNCCVMLLPVCRTFIRYLYNLATYGQVWYSKCLRVIFSFTPLDKNLDFHKFLAGFVYVSAWLHTLAHLLNYAKGYTIYEELYGGMIWVTGIALLIIIHIIYPSAPDKIRWGKFEVFWYNHHLFAFFFGITLIHGADLWNPNFWKYLLVPGTLYVIERIVREIRSREQFGVVSVTHMHAVIPGIESKAVFTLKLEKRGAMRNFQEGQYVFLKSPFISKYQWHPFTIASAPQEKTFTIIVRNQGQGTWTGRLEEYLQLLGGGKAHYELTHRKNGVMVPQYIGPQGMPLIQVDGPYAAPTQHCADYNISVIVGAGIGVTPLRATMQSIIHHRWRRAIGNAYPNHACFHWILRWTDLATFMFMMRTLKDVEDDYHDQCVKNKQEMAHKSLEIHIWLSRIPKGDEKPEFMAPGVAASAIGKKRMADGRTKTEIFGPATDIAITSATPPISAEVGKSTNPQAIKVNQSGISEMDIYRACWEGKELQKLKGGNIYIHVGRPRWGEVFTDLKQKYASKQGDNHHEKIGFMLCGPAVIGDALKKQCGMHSDVDKEYGAIFRLHTENF